MSSISEDPGPNPEGADPYSILGLAPGADFDEISKAKERKLAEFADDPLAKARVESSYDALLMVSLKQRKLGNASNAAVTASKREENNGQPEVGIGGSLLTKLRGIGKKQGEWPVLSKKTDVVGFDGKGSLLKVAIGLFALVLLLVSPPESVGLILSLGVIALFISQLRSGRKPLKSIGWSILLLLIGLILGGLISTQASSDLSIFSSLEADKLQGLPAVLLLWIGSFLLI